jgi:hypothetical protein
MADSWTAEGQKAIKDMPTGKYLRDKLKRSIMNKDWGTWATELGREPGRKQRSQ